MERSQTRLTTDERRAFGDAGSPWQDLPSLMDELPVRRSRRTATVLDELAIERAEAELRHQRRMWELEVEQREIEVGDLRSEARHRDQMRVQVEWLGVLRILCTLLLVIALALAIVALTDIRSVDLSAVPLLVHLLSGRR